MTFAEVCAGIGGASVAWESLGWQCQWVSEIDPFASAVFAYHHPNIPNLGDMHGITRATAGAVDVLVGGPPCQDFSVAGKRAGMGGARGALVWEYLRLVEELQPRWFIFENVTGLLSVDGGRAFGTLLGEVGKLGYGWAYRCLDAQYFGRAQRRRRVFLVGHIGGAWQRAAAVLFEFESLCGHSAARREAGEGTSRCLASRAGNCSQDESRESFLPVAFSHQSGGDFRPNINELPGALQANQGQAIAFDLAQITSAANRTRAEDGLPASTLAKGSAMHVATVGALCANAGTERKHGDGGNTSLQQMLAGQIVPADRIGSAVRRLTPRECERLQGYTDDYTLIPWRGRPREDCPDGPRYRTLGNAFPVPTMRWIGERIQMVEALT